VCCNSEQLSSSNVLVAWFEGLYPEASKGTRPGRFEATVRKIAALVLPSSHGSKRLQGEELELYLGKLWRPPKYHSQNPR